MNNENQVSVNNLISQENSVEVSTTSKNECFDVEQNINSYYSNLAKSWACKEDNMVDGEYFSAKYYAKSAQKYLEDFKNYSEKYLNHLQITNCLLEVPQNIKLELNNGVLTLKAGSVVIVPNGFEADGTTPKFDYVDITSDRTPNISTGSTSSKYVYVIQDNVNSRYFNTNQCFSGVTAPTGGSYLLWYDTTNNLIKESQDGGATWLDRKFSFPVCLFSANGNQFTSIDQVFNGMGYIGSTIWVDKGVKELIPNGRNADGTLNNREYTTITVKLLHTGWNNGLEYLSLAHNGSFQAARYFVAQDEKPNLTGVIWYNTRENIVYRITASGVMSKVTEVVVCTCNREKDGKVTALEPKLPFKAMDYNDKSEISGWGMPSSKYIDLTLGASDSTYTAPANGWVAFSRTSSASGQYVTLNSSGLLSKMSSNASSHTLNIYLPVKKGATYKVSYNTPTAVYFRFIFAEGEI